MNFKEMSVFVNEWEYSGRFVQRMAYLYGYYSEDPNFPDGVRVNVEVVYEPPQIGDMNGVEELQDPNAYKIDMIA
jgi:nuclear protein localization family protein 4